MDMIFFTKHNTMLISFYLISAGIGYGTVCHLVAMGPSRVILACRNLSKAEEAIRRVKKSISADGVVIEAQELNLASFASCRAFSKRYQESGQPLHILINNAGIGGSLILP